MKKDNPFTLMFGRLPKTMISRMEIINDIVEGFSADMPVYQTYLISGVRGSGKTVLMTSAAKILGESGDWLTVDLNSNMNLLDDLSYRLTDLCKTVPNFIEKGIDLSAFGFGIGIGGAEIKRDNVSVIENLLDQVVRKGKKLLITIDEAVNSKDMKVFASQFQIWARKEYPVFLIMTGLYENIYSIQNDTALTFLLRSPKVFLEPLSIRQIACQYTELLNVDPSKAKELAIKTKGYAFAFQALGMLCYEYSDLELDIIYKKLADILDDYVYRKIWQSLSKRERQIIINMPQDENIKISVLCEKIGMTSQSFSRYRQRLIEKGVLASSGYGYVDFALPLFGDIAKGYAM